MNRLIYIFLTFLILFISCKKNDNALLDYSQQDDSYNYQESDLVASSIDERLINANTKFALNIFKKINEGSIKNIFISPTGLSIALTMAYNGANNTTKEEMANVLYFEDFNTDELNKEYLKLIKSIRSCDSSLILDIFNSIWINDQLNVKKSYIENMQAFYLSDVTSLDFYSDDAIDIINSWSYEKTKGRIPEIIENLNLCAMLIMNAIYFKGTWKYEFDPEKTREDYFFMSDSSRKRVDFMTNGGFNYTYNFNTNFDAIRMSFGRDKIAFYIFLPHRTISLDTFIENYNAYDFNIWFSEFDSLGSADSTFTLKIPKFKIDNKITFNDQLKEMGMIEAFDPKADFRGISDESIWIDSVYQKASIEIDEKGSEAGAVAVVDFTWGEPKSFIANRPFLFLIRDDRSGSILFMGKIESP